MKFFFSELLIWIRLDQVFFLDPDPYPELFVSDPDPGKKPTQKLDL